MQVQDSNNARLLGSRANLGQGARQPISLPVDPPGDYFARVMTAFHEIKHDGFRIIARRDAEGVRLFSRNG